MYERQFYYESSSIVQLNATNVIMEETNQNSTISADSNIRNSGASSSVNAQDDKFISQVSLISDSDNLSIQNKPRNRPSEYALR